MIKKFFRTNIDLFRECLNSRQCIDTQNSLKNVFLLGDCSVGEFWNTSKCSLCPKHFYQNVTGKDYCFPCQLGTLTAGQGTNSSSQCYIIVSF